MTPEGSAMAHEAPPGAGRMQRIALSAGVALGAACAAGAVMDTRQFLRSWLLAFVFWTGIALGGLALIMLQHLTGGAWGLLIRRPLEAAAGTLPLLAVLFLPIAAGLPQLYPWASPGPPGLHASSSHGGHAAVAAAGDPAPGAAVALPARTAVEAAGEGEARSHGGAADLPNRFYLNVPFFLLRAALFFGVWMLLAFLLNRWSAEQDLTREPEPARRFRLLAAPGLALWGLTVTFASVDWVMSLDPRWFSTIFGVLFMMGQGLSGLAFGVLAVVLLSGGGPLTGVARRSHLNDLGNLMLAFVMLWAYFSLSQFLIIWSGNLPEEVTWYLHRTGEGWQAIALLLVVAHFALPFLLLLSRATKRARGALATVAGVLLVMRLVDLYWMIVPEFSPGRPTVHWMDLAAVGGMGGLWLAFCIRRMTRRPVLPLGDPLFRELTADGRH